MGQQMSDIYDMTTTFKERVESRLTALGLNAAETARRMNKPHNFVHDILAGRKKSVQGANLEALAGALECAPAWLLTGEDAAAQKTNAPSISVGDGENWDQEAFAAAVEMLEQLKAKEGIRHISTPDYIDIIREFYRQAKAEKKEQTTSR